MGVVYRAEDTRLGRQVAVKFLSAKLSADPAALERFQREARAASSLNHPHICALYDIGRHGDLPFLVMELLDGQTLRTPHRRRAAADRRSCSTSPSRPPTRSTPRTPPASSTATSSRRTSSSRARAGEDSRLRPGEARPPAGAAGRSVRRHRRSRGRARAATESGQTFGTLSSCRPSRRAARTSTGAATCSRSASCSTRWPRAASRSPGKTSALVFDAILQSDRRASQSAINPAIPAELEHIILKALEKDRDLRYQTAAELRADLKRLKRETRFRPNDRDGTARPRRRGAPPLRAGRASRGAPMARRTAGRRRAASAWRALARRRRRGDDRLGRGAAVRRRRRDGRHGVPDRRHHRKR